jgi:luciferase family oxidoreductase group 1
MTVPLSILDLSPIPEGSDAATALRNTVDLAEHAEQWGYQRYWVAEHHFVAVASSSPAVLIGQIAAATDRIRVGSAAVQLGHTTAVAVVESFGMLDAFHPGRIDLGLGRSGQRRAQALESKDNAPRPKPEWRDIDGVIVPPPFDLSALMRNPRLRPRCRCCSNRRQ